MSDLVPPGKLVVAVGPRGPTGLLGLTGPAWPDDSPNDGGTYGRSPGAWVPVLPLTGGTLSGGLSFGSDVASAHSDLSRHIRLWSTNHGFSVTSSTLNCVSSNQITFYTGGVARIRLVGAAIFLGGLVTTTFISFGSGQLSISTGVSTGIVSMYNSSLFTVNSGIYSTNEIVCQGGGINYNTSGQHYFNWNWDGTYIYGRVDNAVQIPIANACDERMKQDVAPSRFDCLAALRRVRLWQYRWQDYSEPAEPKPAPDDAPVMPIGFVAQRLAEDFPASVVKGPREKVVGATAMQNADANTMLASLCGAVQQLNARVAALGQ